MRYFSQPALANILFPTLIACSFNAKSPSNPNITLLASHLKPALLANFIEARILEKTLAKPVSKAPSKPDAFQPDDYHRFENRFPSSLWSTAKAYFAEVKKTVE